MIPLPYKTGCSDFPKVIKSSVKNESKVKRFPFKEYIKNTLKSTHIRVDTLFTYL